MVSKTFKKTVDIGVARDMREFNPIERFLIKVIDLFSKKHDDVDAGHITRTFDWDGTNIWTPCDIELAANVWSVDKGKFLKHVKGDTDESLATLYAYNCGLSEEAVIFGNGQILYHSSYGNVKHLLTDSSFLMDSICLTKDGNTIVLLKSFNSTNDSAITILERPSFYENFEEHSIPIEDLHKGDFNYSLELFEGEQRDSLFILMYTRTLYQRLEPLSDLVLCSLGKKSVVNATSLNGIQNVSKHPSKNLLAVLGRELTILSVPDLEIINSVKLTVTRGKSSLISPISYSSCGRYLALSYAINGEIEVRDAQTLDIIRVFDDQEGIPQPEMSWDITGRYLACRFISREKRNKPTLIVWDIKLKSQKPVLKTEASDTYPSPNIPVAFRWAPRSTALACLVNYQRIQVFELGS